MADDRLVMVCFFFKLLFLMFSIAISFYDFPS